MYLRMASLTFKARSGHRAVGRWPGYWHSLAFPLRRCLGCKRATLAAWGVSHSCRLDDGSWGGVLRARAYLPTRYLSDLNVPLDIETQFPVDVAQRSWN